LKQRLKTLQQQFYERYSIKPELIGRSPGRAEIIGCHTDHEGGWALGMAISRSTLAAMHRRNDKKIRVFSNQAGLVGGNDTVFEIDLNKLQTLQKPEEGSPKWTHYIQGVIRELIIKANEQGEQISGADILIDSDVPVSGGTSSSAAIELAVASGFSSLYNLNVDKTQLARLSQKAENEFVGVGCGYLDQGTEVFAEAGKAVLLKFDPDDKEHPAVVETIDADVEKYGYTLMIAVDPTVKRNLGESGYPIRKQQCQEGLITIRKLLNKPTLKNLGGVSIEDFEKIKAGLQKDSGEIVRKRVQHIIEENLRVQVAARVLKRGDDMKQFGRLLNESGVSSLSLLNLDEKTPELTFMCRIIWDNLIGRGVYGRNMGGGFAANTLMLVPKDEVEETKRIMNEEYTKEYDRNLDFIDFTANQGVEIFSID
jgi:galactokinase